MDQRERKGRKQRWQKNPDKQEFIDKGRRLKSTEQDIAWYMKNKALIEQAGKIAFTNPLGINMPVAELSTPGDAQLSQYTGGYVTPLSNTRVPGIIRLCMSPSLGVSLSAQSPLNVMARNLFSTIQSTLNMKLAPAIEAPDLICYLGAADSIDSFYSWVSRLYGTIASEKLLNKYEGFALARANGVDYDDFRTHASDIYFWLLRYRDRVNRTLVLPKGFGFAKRHYWLYGNYFKDSPVEKSQIYVHAPIGFYAWNPTKYETGTALEFIPLTTDGATMHNLTWAQVEAIGEYLLAQMLQDQDANSIGGFILRGWGTDGCIMLPEVPINYHVEPVYSEEILGQIHNSQSVGVRVDQTIITNSLLQISLDYYQRQDGDSWLYHSPAFSVTGTWSDKEDSKSGVKGGDPYVTWNDASHDVGIDNVIGISLTPLMDSFVDSPTSEEVIINSRNMLRGHFEIEVTAADHSVDPRKIARVDSCGLDLIWFCQALTFNGDGTLSASDFASFTPNDLVAAGQKRVGNGCMTVATMLSKFDWAPRVVFGVSKTNPYTGGSKFSFSTDFDVWDYNNTTSVSNEALDKMHLAALDGAFDLDLHINGYDKIAGK